MENKLVFKKVAKGSIFKQDFIDFKQNNVIKFKKIRENNIAVLYGPNGTGKTSLVDVLANGSVGDPINEAGSFELEFEGSIYTPDNNSLFYIINDQISRNIIEGDEDDYFLGENIQREFELKESIDSEIETLFSKLNSKLRTEFNIKKKGCKLIEKVDDEKLREILRDLVNIRSKGEGIILEDFLMKSQDLAYEEIVLDEEQLEKYKYVKNNYIDDKDIICKVMDIGSNQIGKNGRIREIEENDVALEILDKFYYKTECIVCDNEEYDRELLKSKKLRNKQKIIERLDDKTKDILMNIIENVRNQAHDPFNIEAVFLEAIKEGNNSVIIALQNEIEEYFEILNIEINNLFATCLEGSNLMENYKEYNDLLKEQPEITDEEMKFIQDFLRDHMDKEIELRRVDESKGSLVLELDGNEFLGLEREKLHLSTGEQNFISLAFELIKARNSDKEVIIIDDPMSSFDSIYKNKIAYCLIKFLRGKRQLILTHNIELVRLLHYQMRDCFNLYLLNNTDDGENGFIKVGVYDKDILLNINALVKLFRGDIGAEIEDERNFLISVIPFMRGYANIIGNSQEHENLSRLMHGYEHEKNDIAKTYKSLFRNDETKNTIFKNEHNISVDDILQLEAGIDNIKILKDGTNYPLLDNALRHTLCYLFLRLKVEKMLIELYNINVNGNMMLGQIILKAFKESKDDSNEEKREKKYNRIFFTSRKTLLNEFNHFEGNMNIFQPAIDISNCALKKEKEDILNKLEQLKRLKITT